ncbi:MAG: hypothetical protein H6821_11505 [Planctomycetaceae bacterium]|nr:hypothetical protein [Planctomycetales bacterium]MCB9874792.1 hypothetical protein [Planctomycetaceae bacterium]MCB9939008.1 hypothetical protein [Planctomycetaceae bacterium]HRX82582.1 hypothetical protein [Pirellulaceae bacterium]
MKRIALCIATVTVLAAWTNSASASDLTEFLHKAFGTNRHAYRHAEERAHAQHHADLEHRAIERAYISQAAHQQPLSPYQDMRLHRELDRAAFLDRREHDIAHATRAYSPHYNQSYRNVPSGSGVQFHSTQYQYGGAPYGTTAYGASQFQSYPIQSRVGCSPYDRY